MTERWYFVPPELTSRSVRNSRPLEDEEVPASFYVHPDAGSVWPIVRTLPRRSRGKLRR